MAIYAIGDIQGHLQPLQHLLRQVSFKPEKDQLWLVGDLVNRGPDSLGVLRFVRQLGDAAKPVLGNHDLRLLALDAGVTRNRGNDTLLEILEAPDRKSLTNWLRHLPFVHQKKDMKTIMVHAGIPHSWSRKETFAYGEEVQQALQGPNYKEFLKDIHTRKLNQWKKSFSHKDRLNFIANALTRTRYCSTSGKLDFEDKGPLGSQKKGLIPWFHVPQRTCLKWCIVFGHWSALGYLKEDNIINLDSGCHWGRVMTMIRLDGQGDRVWQYECS